MSVAARRLQAVPSRTYHQAAVAFCTGVNYTGTVTWVNQGGRNTWLTPAENDTYKSVYVAKPSKVYMYSDILESHAVLFTTRSIPDLSVSFFDGGFSFSQAVSSYRVEPQWYVHPRVTASPIHLGDGSVLVVPSGSEVFGNCTVDSVVVDKQAVAVYDNFTAALPEAQFRVAFEQMSRAVCSVLYASPDTVPYRYYDMTVRFLADEALLASADRSTHTFTLGGGSTRVTGVASYMSHEMAHFYQHSKGYGVSQIITGTLEGICDAVLVKLGYHTAALHRPADGGSSWYAGYDTTAFFFDYIENHAPVRSPGFLQRLNASFDVRDPAVGLAIWDPAVIQSINAQYKTVDQLWLDYKAWVVLQ